MMVLVSASTKAAFLFRALESGVDVTGDDGDLAEEVNPGDDTGSALASPSESAAAASAVEFSLSEEEEAPSASSSPALLSPSSIISPSSSFLFSPFSRAVLSASALLLLLSSSDSAALPLPFSFVADEELLDLHGWFSLLQVSTLC